MAKKQIKDRWYGFLFKPVDVDVADKVKINHIPACLLLVIFLALLAGSVYAFHEWMKAGKHHRHDKIEQIKGALK